MQASETTLSVNKIMEKYHREDFFSCAPDVDHSLQSRQDTFFSDFEEIAVASSGLKELHSDALVRVRGDSRLNERIEHFAMVRQRELGVICLFTLFLLDGGSVAKRRTTLSPACQEYELASLLMLNRRTHSC